MSGAGVPTGHSSIEAFLEEVDAQGRGMLHHLLAGPIVIDGRTIAQGPADASDLLQVVDDQLVLRCTVPPDGWAELTPATQLERPDLTFVAGSSATEWSTFDLRSSRPGPSVATPFQSLDLSPDGARLVGSSWPDKALHLIDPPTWSTEPIANAGVGWTCPSWSTDGASVIGDLTDPATGERTSVMLRLDGEAEPTPLPDNVGSCPKSLDADEVVAVADNSVVAVTLDGEERQIAAMDRCNLVPISRPRDGMLDLYANCANPYFDGLHQLDLATGETSLLIAGRVGAGDVSPDGRWRLFVYGSHDVRPSEVTLWLLDQETGQAGPVNANDQYFPLFLPN